MMKNPNDGAHRMSKDEMSARMRAMDGQRKEGTMDMKMHEMSKENMEKRMKAMDQKHAKMKHGMQ